MKIIYETIYDRIRDAVCKADADGKKIKTILLTTDEATELQLDERFMAMYPYLNWIADNCKRCGEQKYAHRWSLFSACHHFVPCLHCRLLGVEVKEE